MDLPEEATIDQRPMAVLGAGVLGRRIAMMYATRGAEIRLYDTNLDAAQNGAEWAMQELPEVLASIDGAQAGTIVPTDDLATATRDVWLVTEAVPENLELKRSVFAQLDEMLEPDVILASNSSSYPSSAFSDHLSHPERVLNTHFMMPPSARPVELMSNGHTAPEIIAFLADLLGRYGLSPYVAQTESVGFIFNRIWAAIKRESLLVLADGVATPETIDAIFREATGARVGPFRLMDNVGLDVVLDIEEHYAQERDHLPLQIRTLLKHYIDAGKLGSKSGVGFFDDYQKAS
ncbi:3-hydroxyacyl-CoA dehydrogenase family protein [Novosphingobium mangrovi (ex Hu et al. 2023)]|uniref:3-hydroxyacyl-CoA dehydrogenase family protein n=1 Tax=Novosphingobium mangrovi (ex Hu et al. 2023) TaxID=2930094 RepID=A0ABT0AIE4_9SPHN|nr:3-hydroxyacyl-CoA dehydrogenase family protein [Novosphingobium mangrovi (ex Hu et al. 2023)]MCJ1962959.1 3-hydroxyacyl-CoA dehydrogenase family protein [Novosphingobium mangrovi (ex Hu et al. 2023)]